jgi:hypothetical protein
MKPEEQGALVLQAINGLVVHNQQDYNAAAEFLRDLKTKQKEVEAALEPQCKAAYVAWQTANDQKKKYLSPFTQAEVLVKSLMSNYQMQQRQLEEEAYRKAQEEARKLEEKERKKLIRQGREDEAEMVFVPVVTPDHSVSKAEGIATADSVDIDITDMKEFVQWLLTTNLDLNSVLTVKPTSVKQYVKLTKLTKIPGCVVRKSLVVSAKAR